MKIREKWTQTNKQIVTEIVQRQAINTHTHEWHLLTKNSENRKWTQPYTMKTKQ